MLVNRAGVVAFAMLLTVAAFAGPHQHAAKKGKATPKASSHVKHAMQVIKVCPMRLEPVPKTAKRYTYGAYNVGFCCPSCKTEFDKLSKAEQQRKLAVAARKS